jgi:hypothetical protein
VGKSFCSWARNCFAYILETKVAEHPDRAEKQGCQMVYFQTKNSNLGKIWGALEWKRLVYSMSFWDTLPPFGTFYVYLLI